MRPAAARSAVVFALVSTITIGVAPVVSADEITPTATATQSVGLPKPSAPASTPTVGPSATPTGTPKPTPKPAPTPTPKSTPTLGPAARAAAQLKAKNARARAAQVAAAAKKALAAKAAADAAKAGQTPIPQAHHPSEGPLPSLLWGVDVAGWQHPAGEPINWTALTATGPRFAFVKVSEGTTFTNPAGVIDRAALKSSKTVHGGYHYATPAYPVSTSALAQARFAFAQTGKLTPGQLPLVLDLESNPNALTPADMATWSLTWLKEAERLTGRRPILYTYPAFFNGQVEARPELAGYPLWIANYGLELRSPSVPAPWTTWTFWQYSSQGRGLSGLVAGTESDLNVFAGTAADLNALAGIVPVVRGVDLAGRTAAMVQAGADLMGGALLRALTAAHVAP